MYFYKTIPALLFTIFLFLNSQQVNAQAEANDVFKSLILWSLRYGIDDQHFTKTATNTLINEESGSEKLDYKNKRLTIDGIHAEFSAGTDDENLIRFGGKLGINVGLSIQDKDNSPKRTGYGTVEGYPSGFAGKHGSDLASSDYAVNFEMFAGAAVAFNIISDENFQVSAGYSQRFWSKGNMGFYVLPNFYGGFWDINATYGNWGLNTTFRIHEYKIDDGWGTVNTNYLSLMPMYVIEGDGLSTVLGTRFEFWNADAKNTINSTSTRYEQSINANSMLIGIYFGLTY